MKVVGSVGINGVGPPGFVFESDFDHVSDFSTYHRSHDAQVQVFELPHLGGRECTIRVLSVHSFPVRTADTVGASREVRCRVAERTGEFDINWFDNNLCDYSLK